MKKLLVLIVFALITFSNYGQEFEGRITYSLQYKSKDYQATSQELTSLMGSKQEYYIKGGNYKVITNGSFMQWHLYINKENKLYYKFPNSEVIKWSDAFENLDPVIDIKINKAVTEILGYTCDELIFTTKNGIQKIYFNNELKVDLTLFEKHKFGNFYEYLKLAKSIPLKTISYNDQFTLEMVAIKVDSINLKLTDFELPKNARTEKIQF